MTERNWTELPYQLFFKEIIQAELKSGPDNIVRLHERRNEMANPTNVTGIGGGTTLNLSAYEPVILKFFGGWDGFNHFWANIAGGVLAATAATAGKQLDAAYIVRATDDIVQLRLDMYQSQLNVGTRAA